MGGSLKGPGGNPWWGRLRGKVRQESGGLTLHEVQGGVGIGYPGVTSHGERPRMVHLGLAPPLGRPPLLSCGLPDTKQRARGPTFRQHGHSKQLFDFRSEALGVSGD